jgi:hypothetical protein
VCRKVVFNKGELVMVRSVDIKSALIGGFVVSLILCLVGAVTFVPPEEYGRFQIAANDGYAFILDSATGQVWSQMLIDPLGRFYAEPDPNFYAPKIYPHVTTGS